MTIAGDSLRFASDVCSDLSRASRLEWLETNGLGGFASSTITGLNTRRYHGLLIASLNPPVERFVLLSKLEETLVIDGRRYDLSANQYPGTVHPLGYRYLREFRLNPFPVAIYEVDGITLEKRVFMVHGENSTVVEYALGGPAAPASCFLELRPLIAFRDYHNTTHWNQQLNPALRIEQGMVAITPYPHLPTLYLAHNQADCEPSGDWYYNFEYAAEQERGLDCREDLFNPLLLRFSVARDASAIVIASTEPRNAALVSRLRQQEIQRRRQIVAAAPSADPLVRQLTAAADQFVVRRGEKHTILAGYHWFTDWGRDAMIALPGIALVTRRGEIARQVLGAFASSIDQGMLPNRFPDAGEAPDYNTADATLWFFQAVWSYLHYTQDEEFVRSELYPKLQDVVEWHTRGTRYGIRVDSDGLLSCGAPGVQLTWMDARVGDWVVTPRAGKPVEIQALWYNALCILAKLEQRFHGANAASLTARAEQARASFNAQFWNPEAGCLYDVVDGDQRDGSLRPNQIFAVSLPHALLDGDRARQVVGRVQRDLLTPMGLRTLSPEDPRYRPIYMGGLKDRDSAYHQGTVWPWLMGPFLTAYLEVNGRTAQARAQARAWLEGFRGHLAEAGLGQISEIADGDFPHQPRGCIAQAWSVAELLRAAIEDELTS